MTNVPATLCRLANWIFGPQNSSEAGPCSGAAESETTSTNPLLQYSGKRRAPSIFLNELVCQEVAVTEFVTGGIVREAIQDRIRRYLMKLLFGPSEDRLFGLGGQVVESRGACGGNLFGLWTGGQGLWARMRGW